MQRIKHLKVISAAAIAILLFSSVTATAAEVQELPGDGESDLMEEVGETEELTIPAGVWSDQEPVFSDGEGHRSLSNLPGSLCGHDKFKG